jgi:chromosome segregation ATPase
MSEEPTKNLSGGDLGRILARLDSIDARVSSIDARVSSIDARVNSIDARVSSIDARVSSIDARVNSIETSLGNMDKRLEALEARAYDTKPIWERALAEILEISKRLESLDRRFSVLNDDVIHTRADVRRLEERTTNLEEPSRA